MKVLLLNPSIITPISTPHEKGPFSDVGENLGLGVIAATLKKNNISYKLIDCCLESKSNEDILYHIQEEKYDLIGISVPSIAAYPKTKELIKLIKNIFPNLHIVIGGHYASIAYEFILKDSNVDTIIIDEGENIIVDLVKCIESSTDFENINNLAFIKDEEVIRTSSDINKTNIYGAPAPERSTLSLVLKKGGYAALNTSKGCYGGCTFCSSASFIRSTQNRGWQAKSAQQVYSEIFELINVHNTNDFIIIDDCFLGIHKKCRSRALKIAELIIRNNLDVRYLIMCNPEEVCQETMLYLYNSGLGAVSIGIESGDENVLKRLGRNVSLEKISESLDILKSLDIEVFIGLIPFDPDSQLEEIRNTVNFLYRHSTLNISYFRKRLMIMPGTQIERRLKSEGRLLKSNKYNISDKRTEILVEILEESLKEYGAKLNNLLYVKKWNKAIDRDPLEYTKKEQILRKAENIINEKSFNIMNDLIYHVSSSPLEYLARDKSNIVFRIEHSIEDLFKEISYKLNY